MFLHADFSLRIILWRRHKIMREFCRGSVWARLLVPQAKAGAPFSPGELRKRGGMASEAKTPCKGEYKS